MAGFAARQAARAPGAHAPSPAALHTTAALCTRRCAAMARRPLLGAARSRAGPMPRPPAAAAALPMAAADAGRRGRRRACRRLVLVRAAADMPAGQGQGPRGQQARERGDKRWLCLTTAPRQAASSPSGCRVCVEGLLSAHCPLAVPPDHRRAVPRWQRPPKAAAAARPSQDSCRFWTPARSRR